MRYRKFSWLVSLALAALFALPHATGRYRASTRLVVDFDIAIEKNLHRPPFLQIYYDEGKGFKEQDSFRVVLPEGGTAKHIQAVLPTAQLHALRLDYLNGPGTAAIIGMKIIDPFGKPLLAHFPAAQYATFQTQSVHEEEGRLIVQTSPQADDPHIALFFDPALRIAGEEQVRPNVVFGIKVFAILWGVLEMLFLLTGTSWLNDRIGPKKNKTDE